MIDFYVVDKKSNKKLECISCRTVITAKKRIEKKYNGRLNDVRLVTKLWGGEECRQWVHSGGNWVDSFIPAKRDKKL